MSTGPYARVAAYVGRIRQGSIFSPSFFAIFVDDLFNNLGSAPLGFL